MRSIIIPDGVRTIGEFAFKDCILLDIEKLPLSLTTIGESAFLGTSVSEIILPDGVISVGTSAFADCKQLSDFYIPASVKSFAGGSLTGCESLEAIEVCIDNENFSSVDGVLFNKEQTELLVYPNGRGNVYEIPSSVVTIADRAFEKCVSITDIVFSEGVESIGERVFYGCSELLTVELSSTVRSIGYGFLYDTNLMSSLECKAVTPPQCDDNCFYGMFLNSCKLIVPDGSVEDYSSVREWKKFTNVEGHKYTDIINTRKNTPSIRVENNVVILENLPSSGILNVYGLSGRILCKIHLSGSTVILPLAEDIMIAEYGNVRLKIAANIR